MRGIRWAAVALVLSASGLVSSRPATAAELTVSDCGDNTPGGSPGQLRRLISEANPGDTIIVPACLVGLTVLSNEDANATGDLDISKDLTIQGAGARATVIDANFVDRVFDILGPVNVTINDLMIRRGVGRGDGGGGIRNAGNLTLNRVVIRANILEGSLGAGGGGIANHGTLQAVDVTVEANSGRTPETQSGVGVRNTGMATLRRSTVSGNLGELATETAGVANSGTLTLLDSTVSGNFSENGPGGIFNSGTLTATGSAIASNSSLGSFNGIASAGATSLLNTMVAHNAGAQCTGAVSSVGGNLATDSTCGLDGPNDAVVANAGLGGFGSHGGPTQTNPLLPGSPAIDTGLAPCSATDQRGKSRPQDGNGDGQALCDKGPFEFTPPAFADVAVDHFARGAIEALAANGITGGCGVGFFCPEDPVTRAQLAVFLVRVLHGTGFEPPAATGVFADVPASHTFARWIEQLHEDGITGGCATDPLRYCPDSAVTRAELSVLILRTLSVTGFTPPVANGLFDDVPVGNIFARWVEEFFNRGVTSGCRVNPLGYCPDDAATRAQIAVFLVRAFGLGF